MRSLSWLRLTGYQCSRWLFTGSLISVTLLSGVLYLGSTGAIWAETTYLPDIKNYSVELPGRGMSKDAVRKRFGYPIERIAAVGTPPISKWRYELFTVYFESDYVIHAVVNRPE